MKQYEILLAKELFRGSDIIRRFSYKMASTGDNYAHFWETDCFACCSPGQALPGGMTGR